MNTFASLERLVWFHDRVRKGHGPNASSLAQRFEVSPRTAKRTIQFLRDRLKAPLEYDSTGKGYIYTDPGFSLPFFEVSQEEMLSILLAKSLLSQSDGGAVSKAIQGFSRRLFSVTTGFGLSPDRIDASFSAAWPGYAPSHPATFQVVLQAMLGNRILGFDYNSPLDDVSKARSVEPHHLTHYLGSWVLLAWCSQGCGWRRFYLSRMDAPEVHEDTFAFRPQQEWQSHLDACYGLFQGEEQVEAVLRFNAFRAPWIREQIWHPSQILTELPDGGVELRVPVADFREIKLKVLGFGADVEVVAPEALRKGVMEEIEKMGEVYGKG